MPHHDVVVATQTEDVSLSANTQEVIPFNNVLYDKTRRFSSGEFIPSSSSLFRIDVRAEFAVGADQDELKLALYDNSAGETVVENEVRSSGGGNRDRSLSALVELDPSTTYSIVAENSDNDDTINGKEKRTRLQIEESPTVDRMLL